MQKKSFQTIKYFLKPNRVLSWKIRLKIAIEIIEGLFYLHSLEHPIIFKYMKSLSHK
ncbi:hypothetical protein NC651_013591 [Populus alba x Populus x berolinensis]|nr:hypothetical protein NC651_013591 [Populus alba x Populus x berolinensis]